MTNIYDRYDARLREAWKGEDTDDEDRIVPDRGTVRVPLVLMDGKTVKDPPAPYQHADRRPQFATLDDAERERRQKQYADYDARISSAWKNPQGADQ